MAHGSFVWNELVTPDVAQATRFYEETLGWQIERIDGSFGSYWMARAGGTPVAGILDAKVSPIGGAPRWFTYLEVDDIDRRVADAAARGGKVLRAPFDAPGVGRIALIADATGAEMGWMTPEKR